MSSRYSTPRGPALGGRYPTRTGVIGIGINKRKRRGAGGRIYYRHYFEVRLAHDHCRNFCLETLGKEQAWRLAVKTRAEYVRAAQARKGAGV